VGNSKWPKKSDAAGSSSIATGSDTLVPAGDISLPAGKIRQYFKKAFYSAT
jgi:hypothetical protein